MKLSLLFWVGCASLSLLATDVAPIRTLVTHLKQFTFPKKELECLNYDYYETQILHLRSLLEKIQADSTATELLIRIKDGFYRRDGYYLNGMLLVAASNQTERDAFIRGMQYEKGLLWFPGWDLVWEKAVSGSYKVSFGQTQLKLDIDAFESKLEKFGLPKADFSKLDSKSLNIYEPYFKLFVELDSTLPQLASFLFGYYTEKSLKNLTRADLNLILKKLISFLDDKERGAL